MPSITQFVWQRMERDRLPAKVGDENKNDSNEIIEEKEKDLYE